jgi:AraC-like DNA-binding protein
MWNIYSREIEKAEIEDITPRHFLRFLMSVQEHCREQREVAWYASELCVTPKYLSAVCQKITGKGAAYWIEYYTLHEILLLLNNPALTLTEVTDRMHFPAPPMLTRYLKRTIGMTPSEYRSRQA